MNKNSKFIQWGNEARLAKQQLAQAVRFVWESSPGWTIASIILLIVQGILPLLSLYVMKLVIDAISLAINSPPGTEISFTHIGLLIALEGAIALLIAQISIAAKWVSSIHSEIITDYMHNLTHTKSIEVDLEYFESAKYHNSQHRAQREASFRPTKILNDLIKFAQSGISLMAMAGLLLFFHWAVVLVLFIAVAPGIIIRLKYSSILYKWTRDRTETERKAHYFHWMLAGETMAKEIRLFNLGHLFMDKYSNLRKQLREERRDITTKKSIAEGVSQVASNIAVYGAYCFIAYRTFKGFITFGDLIMYYRAFQRGQGFLREMLGSLAALYEDNLYLSDLFEFLTLERKVKDPGKPQLIPRPLKKGIIFSNVTFQYPMSIDRIALRDINLVIKPGETIALVGENGSGKTTLIKLLCRLYDPTHGDISIDGCDLRQFSTNDLRREFSVIFQDFARYNLTARENISVGDVYKIDDMYRIKEAASYAGADAVISKLKEGYDTVLGKWFKNGEELSYGEWQKVALARAMIRDSQVVILDEPTSAMDAKAEYEIFQKFKEMSIGKTKILISHRFSTVRMADSIYVLNNGKIIEKGSHEGLIRKQGEYARLFEMQAKAYK